MEGPNTQTGIGKDDHEFGRHFRCRAGVYQSIRAGLGIGSTPLDR